MLHSRREDLNSKTFGRVLVTSGNELEMVLADVGHQQPLRELLPVDGAAHLVLTGGRFIIGPLVTNSYVLGVRAGELRWDFRTTDLDRVSDTRRPCTFLLWGR